MPRRSIDKLVQAKEQKATRNNFGHSQPSPEDDILLFNDLADGKYFLLRNGVYIRVSEYWRAIADDLAHHRKLSLSELFEPHRFTYFVDFDNKYGIALTEGWIQEFTEQCLIGMTKICHETYREHLTTKVQAMVTTTMDNEGNFKPYCAKLRCCGLCQKKMSSVSRFREQCKGCGAIYQNGRYDLHTAPTEVETAYQAQHSTGLEKIAIFLTEKVAPNFHVRFRHVTIDVANARALTDCLRQHLTAWDHDTHKLFSVDQWKEIIDKSPFRENKPALRVVGTHKVERCADCRGKSRRKQKASSAPSGQKRKTKHLSSRSDDGFDEPIPYTCATCNGQPKWYIDKRYRVLGWWSGGQWTMHQDDPTQMDPVLKRVQYPRTPDDFYLMLQMTSIRVPPTDAQQFDFAEAPVIPIDLPPPPNPRSRKRGNPDTQTPMEKKYQSQTKSTDRVITDPGIKSILLDAVRGFSDKYQHVLLYQDPVWTVRYQRSRIRIYVEGENANYCHIQRATHKSNRIYFEIRDDGLMTQYCFDSDCHQKGHQRVSMTLHSDLVNMLFHHDGEVDLDDGQTLKLLKKRHPHRRTLLHYESALVAKVTQTINKLTMLCKIQPLIKTTGPGYLESMDHFHDLPEQTENQTTNE